MSAVTLAIGVVLATVASATVYGDATRRSLSKSRRLRWTGVVGVASGAGFLLPRLFEGVLHRIYLTNIKANAVVISPYELVALHLTVGTAISLLVVFLYGFGSRGVPGGD